MGPGLRREHDLKTACVRPRGPPFPKNDRRIHRSRHRDQLRRDGRGSSRRPVRAAHPSNLIRSQLSEHAPYGGVVPEIAARAHLDHIDELVRRALAEAGMAIGEVDAVAAASGPGLIGGLVVGSMAAKGLAWAAGKPFIAVNHLEAHALAARLAPGVEFPYLLLLVSGGHTQLLACAGVGDYRQLGTSRDDA